MSRIFLFVVMVSIGVGSASAQGNETNCNERLAGPQRSSLPEYIETVPNYNTGSEAWFYYRDKRTGETARTPNELLDPADAEAMRQAAAASGRGSSSDSISSVYEENSRRNGIETEAAREKRIREEWNKTNWGRRGLPLPPDDGYQYHAWENGRWVGYGPRRERRRS